MEAFSKQDGSPVEGDGEADGEADGDADGEALQEPRKGSPEKLGASEKHKTCLPREPTGFHQEAPASSSSSSLLD